MKTCFRFFLLAIALFAMSACASLKLQSATPTPILRGPEIRGVFAGMTPCSTQAKLLFQIPVESECDQMIWNLVLYQDPQTGFPTTYRLKTSYGLSKQGTNDLVGGGTPVSREGKWAITTGTRNDPEAVVYQVDPDDPQKAISFLNVGGNLIHILDQEKRMLVGNGAWSYTLDRMDNQNQMQPARVQMSQPQPPTRPPQPPVPPGSSAFAVFDGRTPCHPAALAFTGTAPTGCVKIKWRLTLYQDRVTGEPGRYLYMGTSDYQEGSWKIVKGMESNPEAILYQLQPDGTQQSFSFLKVDDNHLFLMDESLNLLVGNEIFSYTLSRTEKGAP